MGCWLWQQMVYAWAMDEIKKLLKRETDKVFWLGVALGLVGGLILGGLIGYDLGSDTIHIITMDEGVNT